MKNLYRLLLVAWAAFFIASPVSAQWQVPDHSVPIGRGAGTGFKYVAPGTAGLPFVSNGASADPTYQALPASGGGTGLSVFVVGDLLQANTTTTLARLAAVATGNVLISGGVGVISSWGKVGLTTHVTGTLPVANGGTNCAAASGTCLDNITGFASTGYQNRTGAGAYSFIAAASNANYLAGTATKVVESGVIYQAEVVTTFGSTTTFDFSLFINTAVTLTGNITTQTLSNVVAGKAGTITFIQDGTGSRTTVWNSIFKFASGTTPTLTTTAAAVDILSYSCRSATFCFANLSKDVR